MTDIYKLSAQIISKLDAESIAKLSVLLDHADPKSLAELIKAVKISAKGDLSISPLALAKILKGGR